MCGRAEQLAGVESSNLWHSRRGGSTLLRHILNVGRTAVAARRRSNIYGQCAALRAGLLGAVCCLQEERDRSRPPTRDTSQRAVARGGDLSDQFGARAMQPPPPAPGYAGGKGGSNAWGKGSPRMPGTSPAAAANTPQYARLIYALTVYLKVEIPNRLPEN